VVYTSAQSPSQLLRFLMKNRACFAASLTLPLPKLRDYFCAERLSPMRRKAPLTSRRCHSGAFIAVTCKLARAGRDAGPIIPKAVAAPGRCSSTAIIRFGIASFASGPICPRLKAALLSAKSSRNKRTNCGTAALAEGPHRPTTAGHPRSAQYWRARKSTGGRAKANSYQLQRKGFG